MAARRRVLRVFSLLLAPFVAAFVIVDIITVSSIIHAHSSNKDVSAFQLSSHIDSSASSARLYADQQAAQTRRAELEKNILPPSIELTELKFPAEELKPASGTGFSSANIGTPKSLLAKARFRALKRDGVIRINSCLSEQTASTLREHVLVDLVEAKKAVGSDNVKARQIMNSELERRCRTDFLLSLAAPVSRGVNAHNSHPVATALKELLGAKNGKLYDLFELMVTKSGLLYDLASMVTEPGSDRQIIHSDFPWQNEPPLFSIFCALQDVTAEMGPTMFLPGTINTKVQQMLRDKGRTDAFDQYLRTHPPSVALLRAGDVVVYDPRVLHCGEANNGPAGSHRALLNIGFKNPAVSFGFKDFVKEFGYTGSLRPGYSGRVTLERLATTLDAHQFHPGQRQDPDPFYEFGDGLSSL